MDESKFLKLFFPVQRRLRAYFYAATRDVHETDDLIQQVSAAMLRRMSEYDETRPFEAWAMGMARLEVLKWRQALARSREVLSPDALDAVARVATAQPRRIDDRAAFLADCFESLRGVARRVIEFRYRDDFTPAETAGALGRSLASVEMALTRARRALRDCIARKLSGQKTGEMPR